MIFKFIMNTNIPHIRGEEKPSLTQEVIGSEGRLSGDGGGAYRLVKSKSLNFLPIKDRALSTCCCAPGRIAKPDIHLTHLSQLHLKGDMAKKSTLKG